MSDASKAVSVFFRIAELGSAAIVAGLVGRYLSFVDDANAAAGSRTIYTIVVAGISILAALILIIPWRFTFFAFPLDAILLILWMVSFGLLVNVSHAVSVAIYGWLTATFCVVGWFRRMQLGMVLDSLGLLLGRVLAHRTCDRLLCESRRQIRLW
jgi:hypothetical protein